MFSSPIFLAIAITLSVLLLLQLVALMVTWLRTPSWSASRTERYKRNPGFAGGRFSPPPGAVMFKRPENMMKLLKRMIFGGEVRRPKEPLVIVRPAPDHFTEPRDLRLTWLGHSSVIIEIEGKRVLTDPVFNKRCSPVPFAGPSRFHAPPLPLDALPKLDAVIISHNHYDHLEKSTVRHLAATGVPFFVPLGVGFYLAKWGVKASQIHELGWWESGLVAGLTITAAPAAHFSQRAFEFSNRTLWASFAVAGDAQRVYFGGDSGWFPGYGEIGQRLGPFDVTMLEIGAFDEAWGTIHLGPRNAVRAHKALSGHIFMPIHYGTFSLALHAWDAPPEEVLKLSGEENITLALPGPGQSWELRNPPSHPWWRQTPADGTVDESEELPSRG
ncbi:MBL fold metallo-hydrolase [Myxococcota bacterium]|nr:MBL fold metallo-hydrolase [Myxococcota bacterium]MBU1535398.1 MBL fold metallo-hydrolase [Myxococcota bacterium]